MPIDALKKKIEELRSHLQAEVLPVEDRVRVIQELLKSRQKSEENVLFPSVLADEDWSQDDIATSQHFLRNILEVARKHQPETWAELTKSCTEQQQKVLTAFTDGGKLEDIYQWFDFGSTRGTRQELAELEAARKIESPLVATNGRIEESAAEGIPDVDKAKDELHGQSSSLAPESHVSASEKQVELDLFDDAEHKTKIVAYVDAPFGNWGQNIKNKPKYTFVPKSPYGIQQIVQYAVKYGYGVRVSGYRHSWSPAFARDQDCVLISTLDLHTATTIPNTASLAGVSELFFEPPETPLNQIQLLNFPYKAGDQALVRVGCATTNEQLRSWCIDNGLVTLPLNVIMVEITFGGSNAPICHGAGRKHKTLSDLVRRIEYVDAHGNFQVVEDKEELRAASGCFGLLGVVTYLTLELDPMSFAVMKPTKVDVIDAIPPPPSMPRHLIPNPLNKPRSEAQIKKAQEDFESRATDSYYAEWFWFPYSDKIWINTWNTTNDKTGVEGFPSKLQIVKQWIEAVAMELLQNIGVVGLIPTSVVSRIAMASLPDNTTIKTWLPDALHFRRAIQNTRVRDIELEIPLPPKRTDSTKPDYTVVQQAWWDAILSTYAHADKAPMRMPLEMRIMGDSNVVMAPQRANTLGTCAIEVLTLHSCADIWPPFAQEVLDKWMKLRNFDGHELNIRPHWAKEWYNFRVDGKPFVEYIKNKAYKDEIREFNDILEGIGKRQGWTRADQRRMFSNEMLDGLFFEDVKV